MTKHINCYVNINKKNQNQKLIVFKTNKSFIIFSSNFKRRRKRKFQIEMHYPREASIFIRTIRPFSFFFSLFVNLEQLQNHSARVAYNLWKTTCSRHKRRSAGGAFDNDEGCDKREKQFSLTDVFRAKLAYLIR